MLTTCYARPYDNYKTSLWTNLLSFSHSYNDPWFLLGDFNDIVSPSEKFGGNKPGHKRIENCGLLDLGFFGPWYTWSNLKQPKHRILERLDRCLANPSWLTLLQGWAVCLENVKWIIGDGSTARLWLEPLLPLISSLLGNGISKK